MSDEKFKVGDMAICVDISSMPGKLTVGRKYKINDVAPTGNVGVDDDIGNRRLFNGEQFRKYKLPVNLQRGDRIRCVDTRNIKSGLTLGRVYNVSLAEEMVVYIDDDDVVCRQYSIDRFQKEAERSGIQESSLPSWIIFDGLRVVGMASDDKTARIQAEVMAKNDSESAYIVYAPIAVYYHAEFNVKEIGEYTKSF